MNPAVQAWQGARLARALLEDGQLGRAILILGDSFTWVGMAERALMDLRAPRPDVRLIRYARRAVMAAAREIAQVADGRVAVMVAKVPAGAVGHA
jgi:hypothetical protein